MTTAARAQRAQTPTRPRLLQAAVDAFQQPDIRRKLVYTLGLLVVFRFENIEAYRVLDIRGVKINDFVYAIAWDKV